MVFVGSGALKAPHFHSKFMDFLVFWGSGSAKSWSVGASVENCFCISRINSPNWHQRFRIWQSRASWSCIQMPLAMLKAGIFSWWYGSTVLSSFPPEKLCFSTFLNQFCSSQSPPTAPKHHFCSSKELQLEGNPWFSSKNACFSRYFIGFFEFSTGKSVIFSTFPQGY